MQDWLPGAEIVPTRHRGVPLLGGPPKVTHHITTGGGVDFLKGYLVAMGYEPTLLADPVSGRIAQFIPASFGGYAMQHTTFPTNSQGSRHIQIEWCWNSMSDLSITRAPKFDQVWGRVLAFLRANGVPDQFPFGRPVVAGRSEGLWVQGGHAGHLNAPGNSHVDALPTSSAAGLFGPPTPPPIPKPVPTPTPAPVPPIPPEEPMARVVTEDKISMFGIDGAGHAWHIPDPKSIVELAKTGIYGPVTAANGWPDIHLVPAGTIAKMELVKP